jgi:hypothetical protein
VKAKWGLGTSRSARRTPASHPAIRVFGRKGTETRKRVFPAGGRKFAFWKGRFQGGYQEREVVERKGLVEVEVLGGSAEGRRVRRQRHKVMGIQGVYFHKNNELH